MRQFAGIFCKGVNCHSVVYKKFHLYVMCLLHTKTMNYKKYCKPYSYFIESGTLKLQKLGKKENPHWLECLVLIVDYKHCIYYVCAGWWSWGTADRVELVAAITYDIVVHKGPKTLFFLRNTPLWNQNPPLHQIKSLSLSLFPPLVLATDLSTYLKCKKDKWNFY